MKTAVLLLGSNLDDREQYIRDATGHIEHQIGKIARLSHLYETEPWGFSSEQHFLNQVLVCETALTPTTLLSTTQGIESHMGRIRSGSGGYSSRKIDIDILFYEDELVASPALTIPHPRLHERNFTLLPLEEVMPDYIHPVFKKSIRELRQTSSDQLKVKPYYGDQDL